MHFHANYVSTSAFGDGDYYQATFEAEQDSDDPDSHYLMCQIRAFRYFWPEGREGTRYRNRAMP